MIIGKNFYITEMPKTGTTFLRNYFKRFKKITITAHHDNINTYSKEKFNLLKKKYRISGIRSPYTWYLSLWRWSCIVKKKSPLYSDLTSRRLKLKRLKFNSNLPNYIYIQLTKNTNKLKSLFSDINSKKNFNKFLEIMLNYKYRNYISSDFSFVNHKQIGFMTFYFFYFNTLKEDFLLLFSKKKFTEIIKTIDKKLCSNLFIKKENLLNDLIFLLKKNRLKIKSINKIKKNESNNKFGNNLFNIYTKKNLKLIEKREAYIFKKFKYKKISD